MQNVEVAAICDVDESHIGEKFKLLESRGVKNKPTTYVDIRKMLESKDIDAVSIATPNHWHTLLTIWACQAGKDVYVEKPCSHNVFESQQIVAAARKYNRMVQQGSQSRSSPALREAVQRMREGRNRRGLHGARPLLQVARHHRQDAGRARARRRRLRPLARPGADAPFTKNRFHYNWHWFWDTGNGDIGNQGIHEMDKCRWGLGVTHPTKVTAIGGKFMFDDDQETPNTIVASYEFDVDGKKKMMTFEVRHWISPHEAGIQEGKPGNTIGNQFYGSKGYLVIDNYNKYLLVPRPRSAAGADRRPSATALRQLHRRGPQPEARGPQRRDRGRRALLQPGAPRQHQLSPRPHDSLGLQEDGVHQMTTRPTRC